MLFHTANQALARIGLLATRARLAEVFNDRRIDIDGIGSPNKAAAMRASCP